MDQYNLWNNYKNMMHEVRGSVVVKALCYKPEGGGFETQLNLPNPSGRTRTWCLLRL
jgi:hypothetical protein